MAPALHREDRGVVDHGIERVAAAQFLLHTTVDHGAFQLRRAPPHDHEQVEVRLTGVIAPHARPERVDSLQPNIAATAWETCSYRRPDSRQDLSCGCIHCSSFRQDTAIQSLSTMTHAGHPARSTRSWAASADSNARAPLGHPEGHLQHSGQFSGGGRKRQARSAPTTACAGGVRLPGCSSESCIVHQRRSA